MKKRANLYSGPEAAMSLSRFYKTHADFQAKAVLQDTSPDSNVPVWESIVREEPPVVEVEIPPESAEEEKSNPREQEFVPPPEETPQNSIEQDEIPQKEPPPAAQEPAVDLEVIRQNGFTAGVAAGRQQAEEDFENSAKTLMRICTELDKLRETILQNSAGEMKELVLAISEKIIRHSVTEQEETIIATIKDAIHLAVKSDAFQIQINPDDLKAVEARKKEIIDSISGLDNIVLKPDATVERGGCKLESTCCTVDATIASQIKVIHDSVMAEDGLHDPDQPA